MAGFTLKEQEKATILKQALEGQITNDHAARKLGLSVRQVQRVKASIRKGGIVSVVHKLKGRPGNHRITEEIKQASLQAIKEHYSDFKPTFATEKLGEHHGIHISYGTTRLWMIQEGLWKPRKQKQRKYFSWRRRKDYFGELQQFDGSYHYWLEDRYLDAEGNQIEMCLLAAIDDATGEITKAEFAEHEGVIPVFRFWKGYVEDKDLGKPTSIYLDRFSTYKINHKAALDNAQLKTQFQRAMGVLGVTVIFANSPQAKGRVERLFGTLQDRLIKEMRLAGIKTPEQANIFLKEVFLPAFNNKFAVIPAKTGDAHRKLQEQEKVQIQHIFSVHEARRVTNDFTIQFKNQYYQLKEIQPTTVRPKEIILMETWLDESVHILFKEQELQYLELPGKPQKQYKQPPILTTHKLNWKPPADHPWRKLRYGKG